MSKIDELIKKLCPDGIKFEQLNNKELFKFYYGKGNKIPEDNGGIYDVYGANGVVSHINEYNCEDVTIIGHIGAVGMVNRCKGKCFVTYNGTIAEIVDKTKINTQYFYYVLTTLDLPSYKKGSQPFLSVSDFDKICIPVPPLEVQREIVRILDDFTLLSAELSAELKAREKQYEYYKNKLLNFGENIPRKSISELCQLSAGGDIDKRNVIKEKNDEFNIPVYSNGIGENALYGFTNSYKIEAPAITISGRGTIGYCELHKENFYPIVRLICAKPKTNDINISFLKYYIDTISFKVPTTGIPQLTVPMISNYLIPVPSLKEQERIVNILDRFDKLCNDILEGLPAEIEARQKQYEYYRDKLLTFKELKVEE